MHETLAYVLGVLFIIICLLLVVVVLLQKGRGGGLSSAFGGAGSSAFGTKTGDVFTWITIVLTGVFLLLAIGTSVLYRVDTGTPAVAQVDFSPQPQAISKTIEVNLSCATSGAEIYYTIDGPDIGDDHKGATLYDGKFIQVKPGMRIKARAFHKDTKKYRPSQQTVGAYPLAEPTKETPESKPTSKTASKPTSKTSSKPTSRLTSNKAGSKPAPAVAH